MDLACRPLLDLKTDLGEGLLWDEERGRLLMTDIVNCRLLDIDIDEGVSDSWQFNEPLAWVLRTTRRGLYFLGLRSGIAYFDIEQPSHLQWINRDFPGNPLCRLNDACADLQGKIWYGSMNSVNPAAKDGQLASFSIKDGLHVHDGQFTVTNGPLISADGQYLYLNDTLQGTVYRYRISPDGEVLSGREVFFQFDSSQGYPDGMCFDTSGYLWITLWGAGMLVRINPNGHLINHVAIPAKNVTNVCFCGPALDRLVVSSAFIDMSNADHQRYPHAGALFEVFKHGCVGLPTRCVNMVCPSWT
jgi:sugar lactone lactonase YvrE